jgi:hypothetical protein
MNTRDRKNRKDVRVVECAGPGPVPLATLKFRDQEHEGNAMTNDIQKPPQSEILIYQTEDGRTRIQVRLEGETVWLTQKLMAELFQKDVRTVNEHIRNIYEEGTKG